MLRRKKRDEEQAMNATKREIERLINHGNRHATRLKHHLSQNIGTQTVKDTLAMSKYARLADMTYKITLDRDTAAANKIQEAGAKYINDFEHFKVVERFSDGLSVVFENQVTGELVFSVRGSDTKFFDAEKFAKEIAKSVTSKELVEAKAELNRVKNINDWFINAKTILGKANEDAEYKDLYKKLIEVQEEFGKKPTLIGHSKGGRQASWLAEQTLNGDAHLFDAADSPFVNHTSVNDPVRGIESYRTPYSIVNAGEPFKNYEHINSNTIMPKPKYNESLVERHSIENYYGEGLEVERVTPLRSRLGAMRGAADVVGASALGLGLQEIALPKDEYGNPESQFYATTDALKMAYPEGAVGDTMIDLVTVGDEDRGAFRKGVVGVANAVGVPRHIDDRIFQYPWAENDPPPHNPSDDSFLTTWLDEIHDSLGSEQRRDDKRRNYETERYYWARNEIERGKRSPDQVNDALGDDNFVSRDDRGFVNYNLDEKWANYTATNPFTGQPSTNKTLFQQEAVRSEYAHPYKIQFIKI
jgi:hypothetical protein